MNFIILGSGAVGSYIGGRLAAGGERVSMVARPYQVEALTEKALRVTDLDGFAADVSACHLGLAPDVAAAYAAVAPQDRASCVVLLCVKGGATADAAAQLAACLDAGTTVISLQNGVENVSRIKAAAPKLEVLAGMVPYNVGIKTTANGLHVHRGVVGSLQMSASPLSADIAMRLNAAGLGCRVVADMQSVQWGKLLINLNNPINALSNVPLREEFLDRNFRLVWAALQREGLAALALEGIQPAQLTAVPARRFPFILSLPNFIFKRVAKKMLRVDAIARSSMWDDIQAGKTTEVNDLCGAVVRLSQKHGLTAPVNTKMLALIAALKKGDQWSGRALRTALGL